MADDRKDDLKATVAALIAERAPHRVVHADDLDWKRIRWPGEWGKVAFHPTDDDPTVPLFGVTRFEPGGLFPTTPTTSPRFGTSPRASAPSTAKPYAPGPSSSTPTRTWSASFTPSTA